MVASCVRNPVRGIDVDATIAPPTATKAPTVVAATSGSMASASFVMPSGYSELMIYAGDFPVARELVKLFVKVDSTTDEYQLYPYQAVSVKGVSGKTVYFGSQTVDKATRTTTNASVNITVVPHRGKSLTAPAGQTKTIYVDHGPPDRFTPIRAQIAFQDEYGQFSIAPSSQTREIFVIDSDGLNDLPIRHIRIPANRRYCVSCRYRYVNIFSASSDVTTLAITAPSTAVIDETDAGYWWEPIFTPSNSVAVSDVASFKTACNTVGVDEVVLTPGTYNLTGSNAINSTNYSAMMGKASFRIRSSTNIKSDVVFNGSQWKWTPSSASNYAVLKGVTIDMNGVTVTGSGNAVTFEGNVDTINCEVTGVVLSDSSLVTWDPAGTNFPIAANALWCRFTNAAHDIVTINGKTSPSTAARLDLVGCYLDGNGSGHGIGNDQQLTNHQGGVAVAYGCRFAGTYNAYDQKVMSEGSSAPTYLFFCYNFDTDFPNGGGIATGSVNESGIDVTPTFFHFCDFPRCGGLSNARVVNGTRAKLYKAGASLWMPPRSNDGRAAGSDLLGPDTVSTMFERTVLADRASADIRGSRVTCYATVANQSGVMIYGNTTGDKNLKLTNVLMRTSVTANQDPALDIQNGSSPGTHSATLRNCATDGSGRVGFPGTPTQIAASTANNCRFKFAKPSAWDSKFTNASVTFDASTALGLDANDTPVDGGNMDQTGSDPGYVGSIDLYGLPFLGGAWPIGGVEVTEVRSGAKIYPIAWME